MKKKYLSFDGYFLDRKQSKKYKSLFNDERYRYALMTERIKVSNKRNENDLSINLDKFNHCTIIFINSSFNNLEITEQNDNYNTIVFRNCKLKNAKINLDSHSCIELYDCNIGKLSVDGASNINLKHIEGINSFGFVPEITVGSEKTNKVKIDNTNIFGIRPIINAQAAAVEVNSSKIFLTTNNTQVIDMHWSNVLGYQLHASMGIAINNSTVDKGYDFPYFSLNSKYIDILGKSQVNNSIVDTGIMSIYPDSELLFENSFIDISEKLICYNNSKVLDFNDKNSCFCADKITLFQRSKIDVNGLDYTNDSKNNVDIEFNNLRTERENLVKTLNLIEKKYNKKLGDL